MSEFINAHIPVKKLRTKHQCLWCNRKVKKAIKKRNRKWKQYCITKRDCDYVKYKECRNIVVKELKAARKKFECKLAAELRVIPNPFSDTYVQRPNQRTELVL